MKKRIIKKKKFKYAAGIIFAVICVYITATAVNIWNYGGTDEKCRADAAVILGAGTVNDKVSPVFRERINHGIWLYQNGYVDKLIMTGGYGGDNQHSDAYVGKMYVQTMGVIQKHPEYHYSG